MAYLIAHNTVVNVCPHHIDNTKFGWRYRGQDAAETRGPFPTFNDAYQDALIQDALINEGIREAATKAAAVYVSEFPGEAYDASENWGAEAYSDASASEWPEGSFDAYEEALAAEVARLFQSSVKEIDGIRYFRGDDSRQLDSNGHRADPEKWYYEPTDYEGDTLWSAGYGSYAEAYHASGASVEAD